MKPEAKERFAWKTFCHITLWKENYLNRRFIFSEGPLAYMILEP